LILSLKIYTITVKFNGETFKLTEVPYYTEIKIFTFEWLSVFCSHVVDFYRPGYKYLIVGSSSQAWLYIKTIQRNKKPSIHIVVIYNTHFTQCYFIIISLSTS